MAELSASAIAMLVTLCSFFFLNFFAKKFNLVDHPGGRKQHKSSTPLTGGPAIILGICTFLLLTPHLFTEIYLMFYGILGIFAIGLADDLLDLRASIRLILQLMVAASFILFSGHFLTNMGDLLSSGNINLGVIAIPVTLFSILAGINAINLTDGLDGLAAGVVLIPLIIVNFLINDDPNLVALSGLLIGCCVSILAFLLLNFRFPGRPQALVFLGDSGSTVLGFILATSLIVVTQSNPESYPPVLALWLFAIPLMDTANVILTRLSKKHSPFKASRDHLHHLLLDRGFSVPQTVIIVYVSAASFSIGAIFSYQAGLPESVLFVGFVSLLLAHMKLMRDLKSPQKKTYINKILSGMTRQLNGIEAHKTEQTVIGSNLNLSTSPTETNRSNAA